LNQSLVDNQHVLPAKSIERFCNSQGHVQVRRHKSDNSFPASPKNNIFCVKRVWDQRSEQGYGKNIEDKFQSLIQYVLHNNFGHLPPEGHKIASEFYTLWCLRSKIESYDELAEGNVVGVTGSKLTDEQKKNIELRHSIYIEEGGVVPKHFIRGLTMQMAIDQFLDRNPNLKWSICNSNSLDFVVSDNPEGDFIIPVTPKTCLICGFDNTLFNYQQILNINLKAIARSKEYYFAYNLEACINA
jgi:hypothetical protein